MKKLIVLFVLLVSFEALAQKRIVSVDAVDLAYSGTLAFSSRDARRGSDWKENNFRLSLNYAQQIEQYPNLMWRGQAKIQRRDIDWGSSDMLESSLAAIGGIIYNFQHDDVKNSMLAAISAGLERATIEYGPRDDESGFNLLMQFEFGKRWDLGQYSVANISYAPTVVLELKRYGGDIRKEYFRSGRDLRFNFLKFDVLF